MKKLGLGVLGLGEGRSIISGALNSELWNVVQLCDVNEQLGRERCHEFSLGNFTTSMDELLANKDVDVVGIYTPDHLHAEHVIEVLGAGKHVICTKPFLNDLSQAKEVLAAQKNSGKAVMVGQSSRFFAPFARQRKHFGSGAFGEPVPSEAAIANEGTVAAAAPSRPEERRPRPAATRRWKRQAAGGARSTTWTIPTLRHPTRGRPGGLSAHRPPPRQPGS